MAPDPDSGCKALAMLLAMHGIPAEPSRMRHELGHDAAPDKDELLRLARLHPGVRVKYLADQTVRIVEELETESAKLAVMAASLVAAAIGTAALLFCGREAGRQPAP